MSQIKYKRIMLKVSGEALAGEKGFGLDEQTLDSIAETMKKCVDMGVEIAVVAHYDTPLIPVYENAGFNGDNILETYQMSGYATVAPYGETLGDDYIAENPTRNGSFRKTE